MAEAISERLTNGAVAPDPLIGMHIADAIREIDYDVPDNMSLSLLLLEASLAAAFTVSSHASRPIIYLPWL